MFHHRWPKVTLRRRCNLSRIDLCHILVLTGFRKSIWFTDLACHNRVAKIRPRADIVCYQFVSAYFLLLDFMLDFFGHELRYLRKVAVHVRQFGGVSRAKGHFILLSGTLRCFLK